MVTGVVTPLNNIPEVRSRSLPVMVKFVACFTGLGAKVVRDGKVTINTLSVSNVTGFVPPEERNNVPVRALAGTFTTSSFKDWLTKVVSAISLANVTCFTQFKNWPLIVMFSPGLAFAVMEVILTGTSKFICVFETTSPAGVFNVA